MKLAEAIFRALIMMIMLALFLVMIVILLYLFVLGFGEVYGPVALVTTLLFIILTCAYYFSE